MYVRRDMQPLRGQNLHDASVPVGMFVSKVTKIRGQIVQFAGGPCYCATHFDNGPKGWGSGSS